MFPSVSMSSLQNINDRLGNYYCIVCNSLIELPVFLCSFGDYLRITCKVLYAAYLRVSGFTVSLILLLQRIRLPRLIIYY